VCICVNGVFVCACAFVFLFACAFVIVCACELVKDHLFIGSEGGLISGNLLYHYISYINIFAVEP